MRISLQIILIIISLSLLSCKETTQKTSRESKTNKSETQAKTTKQDSISKESSVVKEKKTPHKHYEHFFVSARSGLNYRDAPKGNVLGKFHLNQYLKVIDYPKITDQIKDNDKILKGEWLGVEKEKDTVYVFNAFLSENVTQSDIVLFYANPYYKNREESTHGFVNLSELYPFNYNGDETPTIISEEKLRNGIDNIIFNKKERRTVLKNLRISNSDTLYIFNLDNDSIYKFEIASLATRANVNGYRRGDERLKEYDYEIGLDLEKKYTVEGQSFAYIGMSNPFETGKVKPIVWTKINNDDFPIETVSVEDDVIVETFEYSFLNYKYFTQSQRTEKRNYNWVKNHHLIIKDTVSNSIVTEYNYRSTESIDISPLQTEDKKHQFNTYYSFTGAIFTNKPPIIYGFYSNSFGCAGVDFIDKSEPSISILCDNRH